jgi:hypothetical protein
MYPRPSFFPSFLHGHHHHLLLPTRQPFAVRVALQIRLDANQLKISFAAPTLFPKDPACTCTSLYSNSQYLDISHRYFAASVFTASIATLPPLLVSILLDAVADCDKSSM